MKKLLFYLFLFLFCLFILQRATAESYYFKTFSLEDGLSQSQVTAIFQDNSGLIWIGTLGGGISVYNGNDFKSYTTKEGLINNYVLRITGDKNGSIWIGTMGGLSLTSTVKLSSATKSQNLFQNITTRDGLINNSVKAIFKDNVGNLWLGTSSGVSILTQMDSGQAVLKNYTEQEGLISNNISAFVQDMLGNIYIGTKNGISIAHPNQSNDNLKFQNITADDGLQDNHISCFYSDSKGNIWIGSDGKGVSYFLPQNNFEVKKDLINLHTFNTENGLTNNRVWTILEDQEKCIWIGTFGGGISKYIPYADSQSDIVIENITTAEGLSSNGIRALLQDREGNIWIGTDGSGISRFSGKRFVSLTQQDGLSDNVILSVCEDHNRNYWFGSWKHGLSFYNNSEKHKNNDYIKNYSTKDGLIHNAVWEIKKDKNNNLWIGTEEGLSILKADGLLKKGNLNFLNFSLKEGDVQPRIWSILEDVNGNIWLSTDQGIILFPHTKIPQVINLKNIRNSFLTINEQNGLNNRQVWSVYQDSRKNIWIGTSKGINVLSSEKTEKLNSIIESGNNSNNNESLLNFFSEMVFEDFSSKNNLSQSQVNVITEDKYGNIWAGSDGVGIIKYQIHSGDSNKFIFYNSKDGLSSDNPVILIFDNNNNLWVGTNKGLDKFNGTSFKNYSKFEGFYGIETNHDAIFKDTEGNIWFGTINGVVKYNYMHDKLNVIEPLINIVKLRIFLKDADMPEKLSLDYNQNHLTFDYIGISLTIPEKVFYQYKMDGFDRNWSPLTQETYATYTNLPPGEYSFIVKACNNDNIWNIQPAIYSFVITPPYWQTWWFYIICALAAFTGIYAIITIRLRNLREVKKQLEIKVEERTREVVLQKEEIQNQNKKLESANIEILNQRDIVNLKNKDITDSIRYAKKIQEAILPSQIAISKLLPCSFIFYRPKDIVSGDFYWFGKKENMLITAMVDCTGHGVPGAFMSVIGNTLLNQIINEKDITEPEKILNNLHLGVRNSLHQYEKDSGSRDGMDIAICAIHTNNHLPSFKNGMPNVKKIEFAGANRPLYHLRDNKLKITKGDNIPIGGYQSEDQRIFTKHTIEIKEGDFLMLFSDGYPDQFGGKFNKKFMTRRFKDLIISDFGKDIKPQYLKINSTFEEWKSENEQVDDVLVMGIQF